MLKRFVTWKRFAPFAALVLPSLAAAQAVAPAPQPPAPPAGAKGNWKEMSALVAPKAEKDPIGKIAGKMGKSAELLAELRTNDPTQTVQKKIIIDLDAFIEELEKQKKKRKSGSNPDPSDPLPDSILAKGPGGQRDLHDPNASARLWGQLPPKERQQILQSQNEGFPAGYEAVLSSYYKHLAQENVGDAPAPGVAPAAPSTRPAPAK
jgi:hypothetical protein